MTALSSERVPEKAVLSNPVWFERSAAAQGTGPGGPREGKENDGSRTWAPQGCLSREMSIFTPPRSARSTPKVRFSPRKIGLLYASMTLRDARDVVF